MSNRFTTFLFCVSLTIFLSSCAAPQVQLAEKYKEDSVKTFSVKPGKANIYVVRIGGYMSSYRNFPVVLDGLHRGFLSDGTFSYFEVEPGPHSVISFGAENESSTIINAIAGQNYFVSFVSSIGWRDQQITAREISQNEGRQAVLRGKLAK